MGAQQTYGINFVITYIGQQSLVAAIFNMGYA